MPVIVNARDPHPFLPSLSDPAAIEASRAARQDVRPMEIAIINLMAVKPTTEKQLGLWLGNTPIQVNLTFAATDDYVQDVRDGRESVNTSPEHIRKFYESFSAIKHRKFDGLIVTGFNAAQPSVTEEHLWPAIQEIFEWSTTNALSSLFLCWGAKAALKHFHDIDSHKAEQKYFGVYEHRRILPDDTGLLKNFPDTFLIPVSRWKTPRSEDIYNCAALEVIAETDDLGPGIMVESKPYGDGSLFYPLRTYILPHPEYETNTLLDEYTRDKSSNAATPLPLNYDVDQPANSWRHTANVYSNWVNLIYEATPYAINQIPNPYGQPALLSEAS